MKFEDWILYLKENGIEVIDKKWIGWNQADKSVPPYIASSSWTTGGLSGGDCWGGSACNPVGSEPEPEFNELDKVLGLFEPTISFLTYKDIIKQLVKVEESTSSDYYANYTNESRKIVDLKALFNYLCDKNVI